MIIEKITLARRGAPENRANGAIEHSAAAPWSIVFRSEEVGQRSYSGDDLFDALLKLRSFLEEQGWLLLCNGARRDAFPSQLQRGSAGGLKVYLHTMGRQAFKDDVVNLLDPAEPESIGTVSEQQAYHQQWLKSLGGRERNVPPPELIAEAKRHPNGWVYLVKESFGVDDAVPPEAIQGAWKVGAEGEIVGDFIPNPKFKP